ncbi:hypothetical protein HELRODRAFT_166122 [Helobdella robusta]|uniref:Uncharacterized protein n=1 Tax=Helobdella robusta TaxID=6412 RepID=T1EXT4_HELRO|nr:hypothetical protein HELRODRAFT_166122 [Helobdella robusta]ESN90456.1 hypothetical protein HELRODRAFT_166122 [Helobdella robusta]
MAKNNNTTRNARIYLSDKSSVGSSAKYEFDATKHEERHTRVRDTSYAGIFQHHYRTARPNFNQPQTDIFSSNQHKTHQKLPQLPQQNFRPVQSHFQQQQAPQFDLKNKQSRYQIRHFQRLRHRQQRQQHPPLKQQTPTRHQQDFHHKPQHQQQQQQHQQQQLQQQQHQLQQHQLQQQKQYIKRHKNLHQQQNQQHKKRLKPFRLLKRPHYYNRLNQKYQKQFNQYLSQLQQKQHQQQQHQQQQHQQQHQQQQQQHHKSQKYQIPQHQQKQDRKQQQKKRPLQHKQQQQQHHHQRPHHQQQQQLQHQQQQQQQRHKQHRQQQLHNNGQEISRQSENKQGQKNRCKKRKSLKKTVVGRQSSAFHHFKRQNKRENDFNVNPHYDVSLKNLNVKWSSDARSARNDWLGYNGNRTKKNKSRVSLNKTSKNIYKNLNVKNKSKRNLGKIVNETNEEINRILKSYSTANKQAKCVICKDKTIIINNNSINNYSSINNNNISDNNFNDTNSKNILEESYKEDTKDKLSKVALGNISEINKSSANNIVPDNYNHINITTTKSSNNLYTSSNFYIQKGDSNARNNNNNSDVNNIRNVNNINNISSSNKKNQLNDIRINDASKNYKASHHQRSFKSSSIFKKFPTSLKGQYLFASPNPSIISFNRISPSTPPSKSSSYFLSPSLLQPPTINHLHTTGTTIPTTQSTAPSTFTTSTPSTIAATTTTTTAATTTTATHVSSNFREESWRCKELIESKSFVIPLQTAQLKSGSRTRNNAKHLYSADDIKWSKADANDLHNNDDDDLDDDDEHDDDDDVHLGSHIEDGFDIDIYDGGDVIKDGPLLIDEHMNNNNIVNSNDLNKKNKNIWNFKRKLLNNKFNKSSVDIHMKNLDRDDAFKVNYNNFGDNIAEIHIINDLELLACPLIPISISVVTHHVLDVGCLNQNFIDQIIARIFIIVTLNQYIFSSKQHARRIVAKLIVEFPAESTFFSVLCAF